MECRVRPGPLEFCRQRTREQRRRSSIASRRRRFRPAELDSDDWYNLGLDLEDADPERAPEAYLRAVALDPNNADAHVNLGRLYQLKGHLKPARRCYRKALECVPDHQLALYNLGTLFDELDELDTAAEYYRQALRIPDAHYNLARICEIRG